MAHGHGAAGSRQTRTPRQTPFSVKEVYSLPLVALPLALSRRVGLLIPPPKKVKPYRVLELISSVPSVRDSGR
jgi:hypothetical protein